MHYIAIFVGALAITFALIRVINWLLRKVGWSYLGLSHAIVAVLAIVGSGFGLADGGEPEFLVATVIYGPPILVWFVFDLYQTKLRRLGSN